MKQVRTVVLLIALMLGGLTSCTTKNSGTGAIEINGDVGQIATTLRQGSWVAAYNDNGQTNADLSGYVFNFVEMNAVSTILNGSVVYNGTWLANETTDETTIDFGVTAFPLSVVNGSWRVVAISQSVANLRRVNGSATLTLQKTVSGS